MQASQKSLQDQSPEVMAQVELIAKQAIANYFLSTLVKDVPKVNESALKDFLRKNSQFLDQHSTY